MAEHAQIIRLARYRAEPGEREALLARLKQQVEAMRALPGLFGAQVCRSQEDPDALIVISRWEDEVAMRRQNDPNVAPTILGAAEIADRERMEHLIAI